MDDWWDRIFFFLWLQKENWRFPVWGINIDAYSQSFKIDKADPLLSCRRVLLFEPQNSRFQLGCRSIRNYFVCLLGISEDGLRLPCFSLALLDILPVFEKEIRQWRVVAFLFPFGKGWVVDLDISLVLKVHADPLHRQLFAFPFYVPCAHWCPPGLSVGHAGGGSVFVGIVGSLSRKFFGSIHVGCPGFVGVGLLFGNEFSRIAEIIGVRDHMELTLFAWRDFSSDFGRVRIWFLQLFDHRPC